MSAARRKHDTRFKIAEMKLILDALEVHEKHENYSNMHIYLLIQKKRRWNVENIITNAGDLQDQEYYQTHESA